MSFFGLWRGGVDVPSGVTFPRMGFAVRDATMTLSELLHSARKRAKISQEKAAAAARLATKTVQRIENGGAATANLDSVLRLADAVGVPRTVVRDMRLGLPANMTPPVTPADDTPAGETNQEQVIMRRLNNDAISLGLQFMEVPREQQAAALDEALGMFRRRRLMAQDAGREDDAEGDL